MKEEQQVVATDVAEEEFDRFCEAMDLDVDPKGMDDEDKKSFNDARRKLVRAIELGRLAIDEKGQPVYTPYESALKTPITFREPTGASLMAMDHKKKNHDVSKMFATMADMSGQPITRFASMLKRDLNVCLAVTNLFMG